MVTFGVLKDVTGYVKEASAVGGVVTDHTDGGTQLHVGDGVPERLPPLFVRGDPAQRGRREQTVALARSKVLRAVVAHVEVDQIARVVVVGHAAHHADISGRYLDVVRG